MATVCSSIFSTALRGVNGEGVEGAGVGNAAGVAAHPPIAAGGVANRLSRSNIRSLSFDACSRVSRSLVSRFMCSASVVSFSCNAESDASDSVPDVAATTPAMNAVAVAVALVVDGVAEGAMLFLAAVAAALAAIVNVALAVPTALACATALECAFFERCRLKNPLVGLTLLLPSSLIPILIPMPSPPSLLFLRFLLLLLLLLAGTAEIIGAGGSVGEIVAIKSATEVLVTAAAVVAVVVV
jgi:hypothetical protein